MTERAAANTSAIRHPRTGFSRREVLQVGYSALFGLGLGAVGTGQSNAGRAAVQRKPTRSVLVIFLTGGAPHLDSFDPKPDAPLEVRGGIRSISTRVPGLIFSELVPQLAARADRFATIRTMALASPGLAVHELATPLVLAGVDTLPAGAGLFASRNDWPCFAAGLEYIRPRTDGLPSGVSLPRPLSTYAGQDAGMLGPRFDPWQLDVAPNDPKFGPDKVGLPHGLAIDRVHGRRALLDQIDEQRRAWEHLERLGRFSNEQRRAFGLLDSGRLARAFALDREDPKLRDRYGRHDFGQSLLLAKRLVEAGIPIVQANMGYAGQWDFHAKNEEGSRRLFPPLDHAVSALLDDLTSTGLLEETLVVMLGEFGRTPLINKDAGRDHWTDAFCALFFGAEVRGGHVLGKTDKSASFAVTRSYLPSDVGATIYTALGVDPASEIRDIEDRPHLLNRGEAITALFG